MLRWLIAIAFCVAAARSQTSQESLAHLQAGAGHLQRGEATQAVRECKAALAADPQSAAAHMLLGQAYLALRSASMMAEAKAELQQALNLDPELLWARFYLARVYMDLGRNDKAKQELERGLEQRPNVPHFLALLGEVNRKLGNPEASLALNRKALQADPALTTAHYHLALAYLDLKKQDEAIRELERSIQSQYVAPEMYLALSSLYTQRRRFGEAEDLCKKAIALDASRPEAYLNVARLYNLQGASDKALAALELALPEGKNFPATVYYQQLQADVFFEFGRAYQAKRKAPQAIQAYSRSLEFDPNRGDTHRQLAELFLRKKDYTSAMEHAKAAEKLGSALDPALRDQILRGSK
ncbi:MAG: tetratricopeptide repeat protein [Acidobacteria bacterium]|nr:tetratricopeptide repeat protein [Acidobacteriota bacterium]